MIIQRNIYVNARYETRNLSRNAYVYDIVIFRTI